MPRPDAEGPESFPPTNWTKVEDAGAESSPGRRGALDELLRRYWPALRAHLIYKKKVPPDRADDLVQSFIQEKILERNLLNRADPCKGKFRTFLLTALDRFAIDRWRKEAAAAVPEGGPPPEAGAEAGADIFDLAWAMKVLGEGVRRTRAECESKGRPDLWGAFEGRALAPLRGAEPLPYKLLAGRLGLDSDKQAANRYLIAEAMFRRNFRAALAEYAGDDVEAEALDFRKILAGAGAELVEQLRTHLWNDVPEITMSSIGNTRIDPRALARLLELPLTPADPAALLRQVLAAPVSPDPVGGDTLADAAARAGDGAAAPKSLGDLLHHPEPLPEWLGMVKDFAKDNRNDPESPLTPAVATLLYYASIAAALARCGRRITRHDDDTLRQGFRWGREQPWVDEATRGLLDEGLRRLGDDGPAR